MRIKLLFAILLLSIFLRFYKLGQVPLSLNWDEVSNSYNAYSILKTGRDEYGKFLPFTNRSFDDYKPPLYMYLDVPAVALFGLSNYSARLPSAIVGLFSVLFVYFLTKLLFKKEKLALLACAFFAIEPWPSHFSRVGFEANLGIFFTLGTFTFLMFSFNENILMKKRKLFLLLGSIFFVLSMYSYHSTRFFVPLLSFITLLIFKNEILAFGKRYLFLLSLLIFIFLLPIVIFTPKGSFANRLETTTQKAISQDLKTSVNLIEEDNSQQQKLSKFIHNRRLVIAQSTFQKYLSHFDINFLFTSGDDNFRHHIEQHGLLFLFQLPLFLIGLYVAVKKHTKNHLFLLSWLILSPIPASLGDAFPHAIRSYNLVLPITIISAIGLAFITSNLGSKKNKFIAVIISLLITLSFFVYTHNYLNHYNIDESSWWQFGYKEAVIESEKLKGNFDKVIVDSSIEQGYIFWLYYSKYDPYQYQQSKDKNQFDKYIFTNDKPTNPKELYVSITGKFPADYTVLETISDPTGLPIIKIGYDNRK